MFKFAILSVLLGIIVGCLVPFAVQSAQEITQLKAQNQALTEENTKLISQNQALRQENEAKTAALTANEREFQRLTNEIQTLQTEIASLNSQLAILQALNQPGLYIRNFLVKLEQQPWLNSVLITGILIGFPGSCIGFYHLGKLRKQEKKAVYGIIEQFSKSEIPPKISPPALNGHLKSARKPLIAPSLN
ncbi:MAG: hypothetical protein Fur0022_18060 [Anaerolineales bacterium]